MFDILYTLEKEVDNAVEAQLGKIGDCWEITVGFITPCGEVMLGGCIEF